MKFLFVALTLLAACSSPSKPEVKAPEWIEQPARTVDNGYIVFVAHAEDSNAERAKFKAEGEALLDMANECSFVPKGARMEDRYDRPSAGAHLAYAKVGVEFQVCEEAKKAIEPDQVRALANAGYTEQIKKYQEMVMQPDPEELLVTSNDEPTGGGAGSGSTADNAGGNRPGGGGNVYVIHDNTQFFVIRQQIAYTKQVVILAPPGSYAPQSPETVTYLNKVNGPSQQVTTYVAANPAVATSTHTWSGVRPQAIASARAAAGARQYRGGAPAPRMRPPAPPAAARVPPPQAPRAQAPPQPHKAPPPHKVPPKKKRRKNEPYQ